MRPVRGIVRALACAGLLTACDTTPDPAWHAAEGYQWRELRVRGKEAGFTVMDGRRTGIRFSNTVSDSLLVGNRILAQGAGIALGDVDGDGRVDLFLARTEGPNALYRNLGGWRFEDITARAGVAALDRYSTGAAFVDVDGDGDLDLLLLATTGPNAIFVNDGTGVFTERRDLGLDPGGKGGTTPAMADVDGDGDLDLYVANYRPYAPIDSIPPQLMAFNQMVREVSPGRFEVVPERSRDFKIVMSPDGKGGNLVQRADPDDFYLNEGGRFVTVPLTGGRFLGTDGKPIAEAPESFGLGARFADLTGDGAPDLYVANDFEGADEFWVNDGRGVFRLADWTTQRQTSNSGMAMDVGDVNGDGLPDLFEVDMLSDDSRRLKTQMPTHTALPKPPGEMQSQHQMQRNTLFLNRGDGTFAEMSSFAGVQASGWSWSTMFMDVDLDGWQDLLIGTGHTWDVMDADTQEHLQNRLMDIPWQRAKWEFPPLKLRNVAYRNGGNLTYDDVSAAWGFGIEEDISHTMAAADLDDDGDLDIVVNRLGSPVLLLRSNAPAPRVAVRLIGDAPNTRAVGARIRVLGGATPLQEREVVVGGLYMSHSDYLAVFATGAAEQVTLVVDWRDGRRTVLEDVRPNRLYEITTATATEREPADSTGKHAATLFIDATASLGGHVHTEIAYDDWERQFLLPNALSQLGPGLAWIDFDGDGDEDLVVGTGGGGRLGRFRNDRGTLTPLPGGPVAPADLTTILGLPGDGGMRLLLGLANWEATSVSLAEATPAALSVRGMGDVVEPLLPALPSSTGPMALADVDGDGDLDLFVGGRAIPGRYPHPASSALFRNERGQFVVDASASAVLQRIGLVSAAVFADIDGDGDADLLLAREWGAIALLMNDGGLLTPAGESWGLAPWTGRWNGIATGDLDGDGRLDLVATGFGRNTPLQADSLRPLQLLHGPFGARGEVEMLLAREDPRIGGLAPLNSYARVRIAIQDLPIRVRTFGAYADASVEQVLGPAMGGVERLSVRTLDHMVFFNRGDRFEAVPLPTDAQLAPAFYAGVADFDGDGAEDVFLSQNFFPTVIGTPRLDTGRGLLLTGDGTGALRAMAGGRSGLVIYGDQRGAAFADMDGDGRLDLAVSQNGAETRFFRNQGATPGLRVRLRGPPGNPDGVGAQVRIVYREAMGPVREVQAGSGYWSQNGVVQVLGLREPPLAVLVRWPGGGETRTMVPSGALEVVVRR